MGILNFIKNPKSYKRNEDHVSELYYLSKIVSSHNKPKGILKVLNYVSSSLQEMGFETHYIAGGPDAICPLLQADYKGEGDATIALVCHADTVACLKSKKQLYIEGEYIFGPGVADNKGGIVCLLESLRQILSKRKDLPFHLKVIVSPEEEIGSPNFQKYFNEIKHNLDYVFGFEPALNDGSIIIERDGNYWLEVIAKGIEAHCGRAKGEELNAFHDFSLKFNELLELTKKETSIRLNIGSINTKNHAFNVVCGDLKAKIDIRFNELEALNQFLPKVFHLFRNPGITNNEDQKVDYTFEVHDFCPPMTSNLHEDFLLTYKLSVQHLEKKEVTFEKSGGASDLCYLSTNKNLCVDGFGPIADKMHRIDESVYLPSIETRSKSFAHFLLSLASSMEAHNGIKFSQS